VILLPGEDIEPKFHISVVILFPFKITVCLIVPADGFLKCVFSQDFQAYVSASDQLF